MSNGDRYFLETEFATSMNPMFRDQAEIREIIGVVKVRIVKLIDDFVYEFWRESVGIQ